MDGRLNPRNKAAFLNFSGVWALHNSLATSLSKSYLSSRSQSAPIICEMLSWEAQWEAMVSVQGRVVRKSVNANPGLKVNRSINFSCTQIFRFLLFCLV